MAGPDRRLVRISGPDGESEVDVYSPEGYRRLTALWVKAAWQHRISYEPTWLGIPIIQLPEDILMMQELIHKIRPDVVVETGVAHGGSGLFYASVLELLRRGRVISIDVDIRKHNRLAIQSHPLSARLTLIEGSSTSDAVLQQVRAALRPDDVVLVVLDSDHRFEHVRRELELYAPLVTAGSYLVVFDGIMEQLADVPSGKPEWSRDNPLAATRDFLAAHAEFEADPYYNRLGVTYCPRGFLKRVGRA